MNTIRLDLDNNLLKNQNELEAKIKEIKKKCIESTGKASIEEIETRRQMLENKIANITSKLEESKQRQDVQLRNCNELRNSLDLLKELLDGQNTVKHECQESVSFIDISIILYYIKLNYALYFSFENCVIA